MSSSRWKPGQTEKLLCTVKINSDLRATGFYDSSFISSAFQKLLKSLMGKVAILLQIDSISSLIPF